MEEGGGEATVHTFCVEMADLCSRDNAGQIPLSLHPRDHCHAVLWSVGRGSVQHSREKGRRW